MIPPAVAPRNIAPKEPSTTSVPVNSFLESANARPYRYPAASVPRNAPTTNSKRLVTVLLKVGTQTNTIHPRIVNTRQPIANNINGSNMAKER